MNSYDAPLAARGVALQAGKLRAALVDRLTRTIASSWLKLRNVWETPRGNVRYIVRFGGRSEAVDSAQTGDAHRWVETEDMHAIGFDQTLEPRAGRPATQITDSHGRIHIMHR